MAFFHELDHAGDLAIEVVGGSRAELLAHSLQALARLMVEQKEVRAAGRRELLCEAEDDVELMHDTLSRALNLFMIEGFIWRRAAVEDKGQGIAATLFGEKYDPDRHRLVREIKAVTFHRLFARRERDGWRAEIIFDV